ncbi:uncharacterized protein RAG0_14669 [Rhynchosporium agropyri]|uniref:Trichothecene 3-O-acetyltransferase n=1 Tax=Rhynchosporium agropyri TaxID=914238 RepID=A0A1E1LHY6_9HELO|nr:uncharacterized protein RAG0_14669 [Rhynchosporium agropyri]
MSPIKLDVSEESTTTIFPSTPLNHSTVKNLSILDNACANFTRCAAIWYFSPSSVTDTHLTTSLSHTLNSYRHWGGRLSYTPSPEISTYGPQNTRYQRIRITYNTSNDIGVPLTIANCPCPLSHFLPSLTTRQTTQKAWSPNPTFQYSLLPLTTLSLSRGAPDSAPNIVIQLTHFSCGSLAVGVAITHCLADAISLSRFANEWAATNRCLISGSPLPQVTPVFEPERLDACAAGNINTVPDGEIQRKARELPMHRYDWYTPVEGQPWSNPKPEIFDSLIGKLRSRNDGDAKAEKDILSPSVPIPWHQWDVKAPVSYRLLHFSKEEILAIYRQAVADSSSTLDKTKKKKISKHDALIAHLWSLIIRSRNLPERTTSYLDLTFGVRARVQPALPESFLGSPIMHVAIPFTPGSAPAFPEINLLAGDIRNYLGKFGNEEISWILHDRAAEFAPQRLWGACLGREHVLLTTWVRSGVYNASFVEGCRAIWVEAVMPPLDGLVEIMEAPSGRENSEGGSWIDHGVDVSIYLEAETMEKLLAEDDLWSGVSR